jgi:hypothetical protein
MGGLSGILIHLTQLFGDSIPGGCWLIVGVHSNTETTCQVFKLNTLLSIPFWPLARFIWALFNSLTAKSILVGEKLVAMYSIST